MAQAVDVCDKNTDKNNEGRKHTHSPLSEITTVYSSASGIFQMVFRQLCTSTTVGSSAIALCLLVCNLSFVVVAERYFQEHISWLMFTSFLMIEYYFTAQKYHNSRK